MESLASLNIKDWLLVAPAIISGVSTVAIAVFAWRTYKTGQQLNFLTGALESHSFKRAVLELQKQGVPQVWWDPNIAPWPHHAQAVHGQPVELQQVPWGIPPAKRKRYRSGFRKWLANLICPPDLR